MRSKIIKVIAEISDRNKEDLKPEARLEEDLDIDCLDRVELCMALEEKFNIKIWDKEIDAVKTVEELVKLVNGKI